MIVSAVFLLCLLVSAVTGILAGLADFRGMKIPNHYSLIILVAFAVAAAAVKFSGNEEPLFPLLSHLGAMFLIFGITYLLFSLNMFGAGDSKLASAYALWIGLQGLPLFLFYASIAGAILGLLALVIPKLGFLPQAPEGSWIARTRSGERVVPYGIAITFGALATFFMLGYFDLSGFTS